MAPKDAAMSDASLEETETDAAADTRQKLEEPVVFHSEDTTPNVVRVLDGRLLVPMGDGGLRYLLAGARANVGVRAGRYAFEVLIAEERLCPEDGKLGQKSRPLVRVGFSTAEASLLLAEGEADSVCFESDGSFLHGESREPLAKGKFSSYQAVCVLLNLDSSSINANTVSLFVDGVRSSKPIKLPESMLKKTLFPSVTFRGVSIKVNLDADLLRPLPFTCSAIQGAASEDVEVKPNAAPADGRYEAVFPIALPDEGAFDWLDNFHKENPGYFEISERTILEWARKSGLQRMNGWEVRTCNDKPDLGLGVPALDDYSASKLLELIAPTMDRNIVVMRVRSNLVPSERTANTKRFGAGWKKTAKIMIGEPPSAFQEYSRGLILKEKQAQAEQTKPSAKDGQANGGSEPVQLTDAEKRAWVRKGKYPDLADKDMAHALFHFGLPDGSEGFDSIDFEWQDEDGAKAYVQTWLKERKLSQKIEVTPSDWFKKQVSDWQKMMNTWKKQQQDWTNKQAKAKALAGKGPSKDAKKNGEVNGAAKEGAEASEQAKPEVKAEDVDVYTVESVSDTGTGEPLFAHFKQEDWMLASLRFELHLLVHAFRRDVVDKERTTFTENHLAHYYKEYYKKQFSLQTYNVSKTADLVALIDDCIILDERTQTLEVHFDDDTPLDCFVRMAEDERRERVCRVELGDATAVLKFQRPAATSAPTATTTAATQIVAAKPAAATMMGKGAPTWGGGGAYDYWGGPNPYGGPTVAGKGPPIGGPYGPAAKKGGAFPPAGPYGKGGYGPNMYAAGPYGGGVYYGGGPYGW